MTDVSQDIIETRAERAITGAPYPPMIGGHEELVLVRLDLAAQGQSNQVRNRALKTSMTQNGADRFHEAFLPEYIRKAALAAGLDPKAFEREKLIYRRLVERCPAELRDPYPITDAELATRPVEEQVEHLQAKEDRGERWLQFVDTSLTEEERETFRQAKMLQQLEQELRGATHEHYARSQQMLWELQWACRKANEPEVYYWPGTTPEERMQAMATAEFERQGILAALMQAWDMVKSGGHPGFFSRLSSAANSGTR